jgi:hypothetical protein
MEHAWCRDPSRDERVRAAEDGRTGPLTTLEECIERQKQTARPCGGTDPAPSRGERGAADTGMRTERITLEVTHNAALSAREWRMWRTIFDPRYGESVRVVSDEEREAALPDVSDQDGDRVAIDWQGLTKVLQAERDAANRERDVARKSWLRSEESGTRLLAERNAALDAADGLRKRVAELEAASGGGEREPDAWGVVRDGNVESVTHRRFRADADRVAEQWGETVVPLYRSPPPPRGWLTGEERRFVHWWAHEDRAPTDEELDAFKIAAKALLSRSSPPEVVKPVHRGAPEIRERDSLWIRALAAAGVAVKEVGK